MRTWLITSTTYGTWLPGDARGFVSRVRDVRAGESPGPARLEHDGWRSEYDRDLPGLHAAAREQLRSEPIVLTTEQAEAVLSQFRETASFRRWELLAASVMRNHFHIVLDTPDAAPSDAILRDLKSYAARRLTAGAGKPASGTWWTGSGSRRPLPTTDSRDRAVEYVWNQHDWLARWRTQRVF